MPIYKQLKINQKTSLWVWEIHESEADLRQQVRLTAQCRSRLEKLRTPTHRKAFLAVRCLLQAAEIPLSDLYYDSNGRPFLKTGTHISISHAKTYAGIVLSNCEVGLDIEEHRSKIKRIAQKFINPNDRVPTDTLSDLTNLWCAKEAVYKARSLPGVGFRTDIAVSVQAENKWSASCRGQVFDCHQMYWPDHSCVIAQKNII